MYTEHHRALLVLFGFDFRLEKIAKIFILLNLIFLESKLLIGQVIEVPMSRDWFFSGRNGQKLRVPRSLNFVLGHQHNILTLGIVFPQNLGSDGRNYRFEQKRKIGVIFRPQEVKF